jgi:hypothetical protein
MNPENEKFARSVELMKAGFDNAQSRISFIDTKVGIAVGLLLVLLPVPLAIVAWLTGLQGETATHIYHACRECWFMSAVVGVCLLAGMVADFAAILCGVFCLTPRGPKGYGKSGPFQNEWQPAVLFPLHKPEKAEQFFHHLKILQPGIELPFVIDQYDYQLRQLGGILEAKFHRHEQLLPLAEELFDSLRASHDFCHVCRNEPHSTREALKSMQRSAKSAEQRVSSVSLQKVYLYGAFL